MAISFNLDEIFEMAEQIEKNGASFYREAARKTGDKKTQKYVYRSGGNGRRPSQNIPGNEKTA